MQAHTTQLWDGTVDNRYENAPLVARHLIAPFMHPIMRSHDEKSKNK